jgi:hypothetical protein
MSLASRLRSSAPSGDNRADRWRAALASPVVRRRGFLIVGMVALLAGSIAVDRWRAAEGVRRADAMRGNAWIGHKEALSARPTGASANAAGNQVTLSADSPERLAAALAAAEAEGRVVERAALRREAGGRFTLTGGGRE